MDGFLVTKCIHFDLKVFIALPLSEPLFLIEIVQLFETAALTLRHPHIEIAIPR
jgi:hypothetical protein